MTRYNLAYVNPVWFAGDNGRVLGYDNAHGRHHRHYMGTVTRVSFKGFAQIESRFQADWRALRKAAKLTDEGKSIPQSRLVAFEDVGDLLSVLTQQRLLLLKALKQTPGSIAELARRLKRDRSAVTRDVQLLERYGVLQVIEKTLPGHGRQKWVTSIGREIQLTARL